jgi:hypothetical protein
MGLDEPGPGSSMLHCTFSVSVQVVGVGVLSGDTPEPFGPRKRGQSAAVAVEKTLANNDRRIA